MNIETAIELYNKLEAGKVSNPNSAANYHARGYARYIYFGVDDKPSERLEENLNYGSDSLAFSYLSIGCCLFENQYSEHNEEGKEIRRAALEKGAEFIEYTHFYEQNRNELSYYYLLVGALAYYGASQYSKAFVVMKKVEDNYETDVSILTSSFLKKDFKRLFETLNKVLLNENYIEEREEGQTFDDRIQVVLYARAFANLMDFLHFGHEESLSKTKEIFSDLLELLEIEREPSMWWVVRLMIIIVDGFRESSLWTNIPPNIPENEELANKFVNNLIFSKKPVVELFFAQRKALPKVLSEKGAVVSLPTSSGKTRIAEIAILQCLAQNPDAKILYLAPFRSLAYEVESTLNQTFEKIGFIVSQLYGNGQFSQIDKNIIEDSNILIATPEKAKVILRANDTVKEQIKLVIIDEGHLLDEQERQVRNEMFVEELKKYVQNNQGKIILLSAVLPNSDEIAQWITQENDAYISLKERVARQRLGLLEFKNNTVRLDWQGEEPSFNANFITPIIALKKNGQPKKNTKIQPAKKEDAVAHAALKLSTKNPLLIFIANARSIFTYAEAVKEAMKRTDELIKYVWTNHEDWNTFNLICSEDNSDESKKLLEYAEYGILCHKRNINQELKNIIERLMREDKPRIIIATMTLGQGVNLGISAIIFAGVKYYDTIKGWKDVDVKDFWNVAGRAGRAFIDTEGKVIFTIDKKIDDFESFRQKKNETLFQRKINYNEYVKNRQNEIQNDLELKDKYFNFTNINNVESGLLSNIAYIKNIALSSGVDFQILLELIAENNFSEIETLQKSNNSFFDWIDDTLLSLIIQFQENIQSLDDYLRQTLAYIQAANYNGINQDDVIAFLKARCNTIKEKIAPDRNSWKRLISSGLPLASAIKLDVVYEEIKILADEYLKSSKDIEDRIELLKKVESIMRTMPSTDFKEIEFSENEIDLVRGSWLKGDSLANIQILDEKGKPKNGLAIKVCNNYFAYILSWFLGAIANRFRKDELEEQANIFEEIAVCCELGLPDIKSAKIYLIGIRSRIAAIEISQTSIFTSSVNTESLNFDLLFSFSFENNSDSLSAYKQKVISNIDTLKNETQNEITHKWLSIFDKFNKKGDNKSYKKPIVVEINKEVRANKLFFREVNGLLFACSFDYQEQVKLDEKYSNLKIYVNRNDISLNLDGSTWNLEEK